MRPLLQQLVIACALVMALTACGKKKVVDPTKEYLVGTWKLASTAFDDNSNLAMDSSEIRQWPATASSYKLVFQPDNTGMYVTTYRDTLNDLVTNTAPFVWLLLTGNKDVQIQRTSGSFLKTTIHLEALTPTTLTRRDTAYSSATTRPDISWVIYEKE